MGNAASSATGSRLPVTGLGNLIGEVDAELQYEKSMGSSRFLRAVRARHRHGLVVIKAYIKPDSAVSLRALVRRLRVEREALADVPNVLTYQKVVETATAGYLIRQWIASNLYDRISTRPFLTAIEKKWISYQLLHAMRDARQRKVPHGDLKSENVLVTSSLSVYITDFAASFKPAYLPLNDPSDFNYFFGTSGRRTCYVAPERFYSDQSEIPGAEAAAAAVADPAAPSLLTRGQHAAEELGLGARRMGHVTEAMDVFSLGCVLAELWRDGAPIFTLTQLFKYREGQFDVEPALAEIADADMRALVRSMISLAPEQRDTFDGYLSRARGAAFPESFYSFLHQYLVDLQRISTERSAAVAAACAAAASMPGATPNSATSAVAGSEAGTVGRSGSTSASHVLRAEADERIERMFEEWAAITRFLEPSKPARDGLPPLSRPKRATEPTASPQPAPLDAAFADLPTESSSVAGDKQAAERVLPMQLAIPGLTRQTLRRAEPPPDEDGPALLILSPLLANIRSALRPSSKIHALDLLLHLSAGWLTDETMLDRVLPYVLALFEDVAVVRTAAVRACAQLLMLVETISPANASVFPEYIVPTLRRLAMDVSPNVRAMYAECIVELCHAGDRFLQLAQAMRAAGMFALEGDADGADGPRTAADDDFLDAASEEASYETQLASLRAFFQDQVTTLLTDPSAAVKRSLLANIGPLCSFFGRVATNDVLLSHMITYLNDRSWLLRHAFFEAIVGVARTAGQRSVEEYVLPLMLQALSDPEEFVVLRVLESLACLASEETEDDEGANVALLSRPMSLDVVSAASGFLCHPNYWLRLSAATLVHKVVARLSPTDVWALVYPSIRPLLRADVAAMDELTLIESLRPPLSRPVLSAAVQWAARVNKTTFWKPPADVKQRAGLGNEIAREGLSLVAGRAGRALSRTPIPRSEEDDGYLDKLRALGLGPDDEVKLVAMRDYLWKLARQSNARGSAALAAEEEAWPGALANKNGPAVQPLDGITPLTIFFTAKPSTASGAALADALSVAPSSVRSPAASSFSGNIARRRLAGSRVPSEMGSLSPLAELRRRMDQNVSSHPAMPATPGPLDPGQLQMLSTPSEIERASSPPLSAQGRLGVGKAAPAIAASSANAVGTMSDLAARLRALDAAQESSNRPTPAGSAAQTTIRGGTALGKGQDAPDGPVFSSNYAGDDPYIKAHLEAVFLATFRDRPPSWGPHIGSGAPRRRGARSVSANARVVSSGSSNRRPEGNLIAYFTEHSGPISSLAVSPDHVFFVSGSEDGSVKVWDTARLEKNVTSRSRATYTAQRNGITALLMLEGTHCVASAAADGSVHVLRIDVNAASSLPKYGKLRLVSNFQLSTPGEHALCLLQGTSTSGISTAAAAAEAGPTTLMLGTSRSRITILDLRTMQVLQILRNPEHFGPITCMCADKKNIWLLVGTLGGVMALWDLRFSLLLKSWRVGEDVPRRDAQPGVVRVNRVVLHPSKGKGRVVLIAFERVGAGREPGAASNDVLVEAWDIDKGVRVETFETCDTPTASASKSRASTASAAAAPASDATRRDSIPAEPADEPSDLVHITPLQSAASGPYADGLGGAAQAIERLVRLHEAAATEPSDAALSGPRASAKAVLVGTEGYSSSSGSGVQVSGGWLDAGKLAAEADGAGNGGSQSGPAGYMLCAGEDRCIRFWDLGRAERSVCVGASDERSEFRFQAPSASQRLARHVHRLHASSGSSTTRALARSPLLPQQQAGPAQALMRAHTDAINALAVIESPFRAIVAGDRSGVLRVWE